MSTSSVEQFWNSYLATLPEQHSHRLLPLPEAWGFGDSPEMADDLGGDCIYRTAGHAVLPLAALMIISGPVCRNERRDAGGDRGLKRPSRALVAARCLGRTAQRLSKPRLHPFVC